MPRTGPGGAVCWRPPGWVGERWEMEGEKVLKRWDVVPCRMLSEKMLLPPGIEIHGATHRLVGFAALGMSGHDDRRCAPLSLAALVPVLGGVLDRRRRGQRGVTRPRPWTGLGWLCGVRVEYGVCRL